MHKKQRKNKMSELSNFTEPNVSFLPIPLTQETFKSTQNDKNQSAKEQKKQQKQAKNHFFSAITEIFP